MTEDYLRRIGQLIRDARQHRGWTQAQLAEVLGTSQSAVNRIERGHQNITLEMVARIGEALDSEIMTFGPPPSGPTHLRVTGPTTLSGSIDVKSSKNAGVALLCASLLNRGRTTLRRVARIEEVREPYVRGSILCRKEDIGAVMELCQDRRGEHQGMHFLGPERVQIQYDLPLAEIVLDFFDQLKSRTRGYASFDYDITGMRASNMVKLDILLAGDAVDALSMVVHRDKAFERGKVLTEKLRGKIPRQQYDVPIQAAIGSHIIARETVKAFRKDVTSKCYGGDISRKRKLLERQKEGKKRMKQVGRIEVPQEAFLAVLELGDSAAAKS